MSISIALTEFKWSLSFKNAYKCTMLYALKVFVVKESNYLEKMLINGDLTEMYYLSLESEKDYLVENLELVKEEENKDTIKQNWIFTLIEKKTDKDLKCNEWKLKATIYKSKSTNKITYFNLQDKPYYD